MSHASPSAMTQLPTHVSHYEIRRVLGQGGMGTVYLAIDPALQRQVALKVLRADTDDQRERFRREARIVARLQHPNIVAIYAVGEHEQQPFIAMEYIEGEPLSDGIRRRAPWSVQRKLQMAVDLCAGLAFAHRAGVVHRDVKPSNLMVSNGTGTVRLLDFGIARGVDAAATMGLTMLGNIVGTLNYMSPEQITGAAPRSPERHLRGRSGPVRAARVPAGVSGGQPRDTDLPHRARLGRTTPERAARSRS